MLSIVVFYTALLFAILLIVPINGYREPQVGDFIRLLNYQDGGKPLLASEESSSDDKAHGSVNHLRTMDVIKLIQQANKQKAMSQKNSNRHRDNTSNNLYSDPRNDLSRIKIENDPIKNRILEQLLNENTKAKKISQNSLSPNRLLGTQYSYEEKDTVQNHFNDYSKIYVILDPIALQKSRNAENLPNLLSRILKQTATDITKSQDQRSNAERYKGFLVKNGIKIRRFNRKSKETYAGDDEYRPKRPRIEYAGGAGRTAIPYIRQRGDIYEKDH